MNLSAQPARGTRDILPSEASLRAYISQQILYIYRHYGFMPIETSALLDSAIISNSEGGENEHLTFRILKRGEKLDLTTPPHTVDALSDLALRFDLTVPLARLYAHNRAALPTPCKVVQVGPVWRAERPQKGRYRQFTQCDIDCIGVSDISAEIELLIAATQVLQHFQVADYTVYINDRRIVNAILDQCGFDPDQQTQIMIIIDKLDKIGFDGVCDQLRAQSFATAAVEKLCTYIQNTTLSLDDVQKINNIATLSTDVTMVMQHLAAQNIPCRFDFSLMRGMGYYTGIVFEIRSSQESHSIAGGGRYDTMIGKFTRDNVPAVGVSFGFERLVDLLQGRGVQLPASDQRVVVYDTIEQYTPEIVKHIQSLRQHGVTVLVVPKRNNFQAQLSELYALGYGAYATIEHDQLSEFTKINS